MPTLAGFRKVAKLIEQCTKSMVDFGMLRIELQGMGEGLEGGFELVDADVNLGTLEVDLSFPRGALIL